MAGFNTAVTGLKSSSSMLDVAGNNIANSSTVGFKASRTEFADIFATSVVGAGASNQPGSGVTVSDISQDFSAGTIEFTNNNLDLAINGSGFFQLDDGQGGITYTRAGGFELDKDGNIVSKNGKFLQGYGLDALGNQLPLQNLEVTQKESPPKATESIDLSFNIDSSADASLLSRTFDKTNPGSYTYSTTVETVDSLGNSNSVRFYLVEQAAVREVYQYDLSTLVTAPSTVGSDVSGTPVNTTIANLNQETFTLEITTTDGTTVTANVDLVNNNVSGGTYSAVAASLTAEINAEFGADYVEVVYDSTAGTMTLTVVDDELVNSGAELVTSNFTDNSTSGVLTAALGAEDTYGTDPEGLVLSSFDLSFDDLLDLQNAVINDPVRSVELENLDPRIDINTLSYNTTTGIFSFELKAASTATGDMVVQGAADTEVSLVGGAASERDANEVHTLTLDDATDAFQDPAVGTTRELAGRIDISIGGVDIQLSAGLTADEIGAQIEAFEREITNKNPSIESLTYNNNTNQLQITYTAVAGNVDLITVTSNSATAGVEGIAPFTVDADNPTEIEIGIVEGDNSYLGQYRMYGFLNDQTALDMGKIVDPGEAGYPNLTEVGPVVVGFDSTTGILSSVNGETVPTGGTAPSITILGADPANPNDTILDNDVDSLAGIQLDITGSSQFASESIVKAASQDGYPKGDLIGVTFAETGEMVASFSNGQRQNLGLVAIASFENQAGLSSAGSTEWIATLASGAAILNPPGTGLNGTLRSAALESSNVDLSAELVKLIEAQRNFQANSKTLETQNTVTQAILQI